MTLDETLEMDISEFDIANDKQMAKYHNDLAMEHKQALKGTLGIFDPRNKHNIAYQLHRLAADLFRTGKREDGHRFSIAADLLSDRIELEDWR